MFALCVRKILVAVHAEQRGQSRLIRSIEQRQIPSERGGSDAGRADGVADVMMAVAKGPFAVFPGFPPDDGGKSQQTCVGGKSSEEASRVLRGKLSPQFQSMIVRCVVVQAVVR